MNGFLWHATTENWRVWARLALALAGIAFIGSHIWYWHRAHAVTVQNAPSVARRHFRRLRGIEARAVLDPLMVQWGLNKELRAGALAQLLSGVPPKDRVRETQTFTGRTIEWDVSYDLPPGSVVSLLGKDVILVSMRLKPAHYGKRVVWGDGVPLRVASENENRAFMYGVCYAYVAVLLAHTSADTRNDFLARIANLVAATRPHPKRTDRLCKDLLQEAGGTGLSLHAAAVNLLRKADRRAPVFAFLPDGSPPPETVRHTYTSSIKDSPLPVELDWWRGMKDKLRMACRLPSKFTAFDLGRALTADSYQLDIVVPQGLYVDEAYVLLGSQRLEKLTRGTLRKAHVSWTAVNGRPDLRIFTWRLGDVRGDGDPQVVVRLNETPPGSVASSALVAMATLLSVWLIGIVSGLQLMQVAAGGSPTTASFDVLALATSLPALISVWWGLTMTRAAGVFRSLTAFASLAVSLALTLSSIIVYAYRFAAPRSFLLLFDPPEKTFFLLRDWASASLFALALVNVGCVLGLLLSRVGRYLALRRGVPTAPGRR